MLPIFKFTIPQNPLAAEHGDARGRAPLTMVEFLRAHALGHESRPFVLVKLLEAVRAHDRDGDALGQAAVVAEEVLGPGGGEAGAR